MSRIAIDFDDTIFDTKNRIPMKGAVKAINKLYNEGNQITVFTTRPDYFSPDIEAMMRAWGIKFHRVICGKPTYDLLIDDKAQKFIKW